jgi:hypothetical protein
MNSLKLVIDSMREKPMTDFRTTLTQKQITKLNNDFLNFKSKNPESKKSFSEFKREFFKARHKKDIEKAKEDNKKVRKFLAHQKKNSKSSNPAPENKILEKRV